MTKKIRLIILLILSVLFLIITPFIIIYSIGYRVDFENKKIMATGGIYVKVLPQGTDIIIDSKIKNRTGFFSNSIFVQNLLPKQHEILIKKEGYYDYQKDLIVKGNEVIKLENVILFKQKILFDLLESDIDYFSAAPDNNALLTIKTGNNKIDFELIGLTSKQKIPAVEQSLLRDRQNFSLSDDILEKAGLSLKNTRLDNWEIKWSNDSNKILLNIENHYFLLEPFLSTTKIMPLSLPINSKDVFFNLQDFEQVFFIQGKNLYSNKQNIPIVKNIIAYQITNQGIIWLSYDGFLYNSDITGKTNEKISQQIFPVKKNSSYKIIDISGVLFLQEDESLFLLNQKSKIFEKFYSPVKNLKISPDGQKILYCNDNETFYSFLNDNSIEKISLNKSSEKISDCYWLNNDYLIFDSGNKIIISEIDNRGNINTINLPSTASLLNGENINIYPVKSSQSEVSRKEGQFNGAKKPKIFFNQRDKKLYILTQNNLFTSERLIP